MRRAWGDAHAKVEREGACRSCRARGRVEAAHTIGRRHDQPLPGGLRSILWVDPDDVVPLCPTCHRAYDAHQLDLVPVLTYAEQAAAVRHVGLVRALHRLSGCQSKAGGDNLAAIG